MNKFIVSGVAFVAQSVGMDYIGPFTFNGVRSLIGGVVLIPCIFIIRKFKGEEKNSQTGDKKKLIAGGLICGVIMFVASSLQQIGIQYTTVGKAGFITALYIIIVPILGIFIRKKIPWTIWISVVIAVVGMYLLCITEGFSISKGDFIVFLCALAFSVHIMVVDYFAPHVDGVAMSCIQFLTAGILSLFPMFKFENPSIDAICISWMPILYAAVMSCAVAYTLQIIGQKYTEPFVASLIMSLESVISVLAGWVILHQVLSPREIFGCVMVFIAIIIAQCPIPTLKKEKKYGK